MYPAALALAAAAAALASVSALQASVFDLDTSYFSIWCITITTRLYQVVAKIGPIMYPYGHYLHIMHPIFALFWYF